MKKNDLRFFSSNFDTYFYSKADASVNVECKPSSKDTTGPQASRSPRSNQLKKRLPFSSYKVDTSSSACKVMRAMHLISEEKLLLCCVSFCSAVHTLVTRFKATYLPLSATGLGRLHACC